MTKLEKLGLRMDSCCEITFDVELDEKDMFGREGNGFNRVKEEFDHERFGSPDQLRYGDAPLKMWRATPTSVCSLARLLVVSS
ncbi:protein of unknown function [Escherichia coli]|nr:protein of unknown function [Escherichia coli]